MANQKKPTQIKLLKLAPTASLLPKMLVQLLLPPKRLQEYLESITKVVNFESVTKIVNFEFIPKVVNLESVTKVVNWQCQKQLNCEKNINSSSDLLCRSSVSSQTIGTIDPLIIIQNATINVHDYTISRSREATQKLEDV